MSEGRQKWCPGVTSARKGKAVEGRGKEGTFAQIFFLLSFPTLFHRLSKQLTLRRREGAGAFSFSPERIILK